MIDVLLLLAPALALLCALLAGSYPGEQAIAALAGGRPPSRRPRARADGVSPHRDALPLPRGGRLVAAAIAARPPPDGCRPTPHPSIRSIHLQKESPMHRTTIAATLALAATVALPAAAGAHVTLQPNEAPAGGFARLDVRVPSERDDAPTRKIVVELPAGFATARYEPVPGWKIAVAMRKLATPVTSEGETQTEEVDTITFAATGANRGIEPGQFQDFGISVRLPERAAGTKLTFKALQTYAGGEVVRWIGGPDADEPAPQVTLTAAADDAAAHGDPAKPTATATSAEAGADDEEDGNGLAIVALVVGGLGLLAGMAGLLVARRAQTS